MRVAIRILLLAAIGLAANAKADVNISDAAVANPPVRTLMTEEGSVFTTSAGMTLYTYASDDSTPGKSQCLSVPRTDFPDPTAGFGKYTIPRASEHKSCVQKWPPLMAAGDARAAGDWSLIARTEGGRQWAYQGHPLYTSTKDAKPGDINGMLNIGQLRGWRLATPPLGFPPGLKLVRNSVGMIIATKNERPLYTPVGDSRGDCAGCDEKFRPVAAPAIANVTGDWSIIDASAGRRQYAFKGQPLYSAAEGLSSAEIAASGEWRVVIYSQSAGTPVAIKSHMSLLGDVYATASGLTLYVFTCMTPVGDGVRCDDPGEPASYWSALCGDAKDCSRRWRPYAAPPGARPVGEWSIVDVADPIFVEATGTTYPSGTPRVKAWAFRGRPLYTYFRDEQPGDIWGHSLRWFSFSGFYALQVPGRGLLD